MIIVPCVLLTKDMQYALSGSHITGRSGHPIKYSFGLAGRRDPVSCARGVYFGQGTFLLATKKTCGNEWAWSHIGFSDARLFKTR